jgi:DNA invertase Pin-like site-specific DNA recombinase
VNDGRRATMTRLAITQGEHTPFGQCSNLLLLVDNNTRRYHYRHMSKRIRSGNPLVAVAYIRVSKDEQKLGPEAQRAAVEGWAAREGVSVASWHVDQGVCSVTSIEGRPALVAALAALRGQGAGVLVVAKRDRIARDPGLTASIEHAAAEAGAVVRSSAGEGNGSTPADEFMRGVIDSAARYERALIRARTKAALAAKSAKGERVGAVPYGFALAADGVHLEADPAEQGVLTVVRELRAAGLSQRAIAGELAARGLISRTDKAFGQTQVARMLSRAV